MSKYKLYYYEGSRHSAAVRDLMDRSGLEYEAKCYGDDRRELEGLWRDLRIGELPVLIHKSIRYTGLELIREHIVLISKKTMQKACGGKCRDCHFWRSVYIVGCECGGPGCPRTLHPEFGKCILITDKHLIPGCSDACKGFKGRKPSGVVEPVDWTTCDECHYWRTEQYGWGKRPHDTCRFAVCTARDSFRYNVGVSRTNHACATFYDRHINLNFLQREGVEQGFSPGKSPVEGYFANHPEESWEDAFPPEYRAARRNHE